MAFPNPVFGASQSESISQERNHADMHSGHYGGAEIHRDTVRLSVVQSGFYSFA